MKISAVSDRINRLSTLKKAAIVISGYTIAFLFAVLIVFIYTSLTSGPDRQTYGAMFEFGDTLLFLAAFGAVSTIPTALMLIFLRRNQFFWIIGTVIALSIASTGIIAIGLSALMRRGVALSAGLNLWAALEFPRAFVSPFLATAFGLCALIAPTARFRWLLFTAVCIEAMISTYGFFHWFGPLLLQRR